MAFPIIKLTSPRFLGMVGFALFIGCTIGFVVYHALAKRLVDDNNIVLGRDFMAFYLAGRIVNEGEGEHLYDQEQQQKTQDAILAPEKLDGLAFYINPASVAVAYSLLARLPYLWAFYLHTALMLLFFAGGMWTLKPHLASLSKHWWVAVLIGLTWFPMMHTIMGGQNAALSFMLLSIAYTATIRKKQWLAGLALGLLLFKPQYAVPILGLLLLRKQFITISLAVLIGAGQYLLAALFCGWNWIARMAETMSSYYSEQERMVSGPTHIAITEVLDYSIVKPFEKIQGFEGIAHLVKVLGFVLVGLAVLYLIWTWRRADPNRSDFGLYWALISSAMLLISLHTQYYECALLVLPILLIIDYMGSTGRQVSYGQRLMLVLIFTAFILLYPIPEKFGWFRFQPVILLPIGVAWWATRLIHQKTAADHETAGH